MLDLAMEHTNSQMRHSAALHVDYQDHLQRRPPQDPDLARSTAATDRRPARLKDSGPVGATPDPACGLLEVPGPAAFPGSPRRVPLMKLARKNATGPNFRIPHTQAFPTYPRRSPQLCDQSQATDCGTGLKDGRPRADFSRNLSAVPPVDSHHHLAPTISVKWWSPRALTCEGDWQDLSTNKP
jgi:hypothetical protein